MEESDIDELLVELTLATAVPLGLQGRDVTRATGASNALACISENLDKTGLRQLAGAVPTMLNLLTIDIDAPASCKAALALRQLMRSRICMAIFLEREGLSEVSCILTTLFSNKKLDMSGQSLHRILIEHIAAIYREVGRFYPWKIVDVDGLRHCVTLLRKGDRQLKTLAAGVLAVLSVDLEICKRMFMTGAIKPLLNAVEGPDSEDTCILAGLGCLTQMCRIPEIGIKIMKQGALPALEKSLHRREGYNIRAIREKALYTLCWLSRIPEVRDTLGTKDVVKGMKRELYKGTLSSKLTVVQLMLNLHLRYPEGVEGPLVKKSREAVMLLFKEGTWYMRNFVCKVLCVLYPTEDDRRYFIDNAAIQILFEVITAKNADLQEAPLVVMLSFCSLADIPPRILDSGGAKVFGDVLFTVDGAVRELAIVLLKALSLYNRPLTVASVPIERKYLLNIDPIDPQLFGTEYGDLVEEYLQKIVENRHEQHYLLEQFESEEVRDLGLSDEEMEVYQENFMELDTGCQGFLDQDALKVLLFLTGEKMDDWEIEELFKQYNVDKTGSMKFHEYVLMMKAWNDKFGTGIRKHINVFTMRGVLGRARRWLDRWWHQKEYDKIGIQEARDKREFERLERLRLAEEHWQHEKIRLKRQEAANRKGISLDDMEDARMGGGGGSSRAADGGWMLYKGDEDIDVDELLEEFESSPPSNEGGAVTSLSTAVVGRSSMGDINESSSPTGGRLLAYSGRGPTMGLPQQLLSSRIGPAGPGSSGSMKNRQGTDGVNEEEWELAKRDKASDRRMSSSSSHSHLPLLPSSRKSMSRNAASASVSSAAGGSITSRSWTTNASMR